MGENKTAKNAQVISWESDRFSGDEVSVRALAENGSAKEIQIIMPKGSAMKEHKAPFDISIQVLRGAIILGVEGDKESSAESKLESKKAESKSGFGEFRLNALDMISLSANVVHCLNALEDSIIRLSLAKGDSLKRVSAVLK